MKSDTTEAVATAVKTEVKSDLKSEVKTEPKSELKSVKSEDHLSDSLAVPDLAFSSPDRAQTTLAMTMSPKSPPPARTRSRRTPSLSPPSHATPSILATPRRNLEALLDSEARRLGLDRDGGVADDPTLLQLTPLYSPHPVRELPSDFYDRAPDTPCGCESCADEPFDEPRDARPLGDPLLPRLRVPVPVDRHVVVGGVAGGGDHNGGTSDVVVHNGGNGVGDGDDHNGGTAAVVIHNGDNGVGDGDDHNDDPGPS